jgi:hypothetical protein
MKTIRWLTSDPSVLPAVKDSGAISQLVRDTVAFQWACGVPAGWSGGGLQGPGPGLPAVNASGLWV